MSKKRKEKKGREEEKRGEKGKKKEGERERENSPIGSQKNKKMREYLCKCILSLVWVFGKDKPVSGTKTKKKWIEPK